MLAKNCMTAEQHVPLSHFVVAGQCKETHAWFQTNRTKARNVSNSWAAGSLALEKTQTNPVKPLQVFLSHYFLRYLAQKTKQTKKKKKKAAAEFCKWAHFYLLFYLIYYFPQLFDEASTLKIY